MVRADLYKFLEIVDAIKAGRTSVADLKPYSKITIMAAVKELIAAEREERARLAEDATDEGRGGKQEAVDPAKHELCQEIAAINFCSIKGCFSAGRWFSTFRRLCVWSIDIVSSYSVPNGRRSAEAAPFGGLLLLLGLFTRPVAFVLAGEMAFAYFRAHQPRGFWPIQNGGELAVLYCFVFLYLWTAGPGPLSLDHIIRKSPKV